MDTPTYIRVGRKGNPPGRGAAASPPGDLSQASTIAHDDVMYEYLGGLAELIDNIIRFCMPSPYLYWR
jgi:hypothetical protein